jgi:hypothetical protein
LIETNLSEETNTTFLRVEEFPPKLLHRSPKIYGVTPNKTVTFISVEYVAVDLVGNETNNIPVS